MYFIPRQHGWMLLTNPWFQMASLLYCLGKLLYKIRSETKMLSNIPDFNIVLALTSAAVIGWLGAIVYSRYYLHIKDNKDSGEEKLRQCREFAFVPYLLIPLVFGALAVFGALYTADYAVVHGYIAGAEEVAVTAAVAGAAIYAVLDKVIVRRVGDSVYFHTIEDKITDRVETVTETFTDDELAVLKVIKSMKK